MTLRYFRIIFLLTGILLGSVSCRVLKYDKINLKKVDSTNFLERKLKKEGKYDLYIHNIGTGDTISYPLQIPNAQIINEGVVVGKITSTAETKIQREYYYTLREKERDKHVYTKVDGAYTKTDLDQIHVWVSDSLYESMYGEIRFKTNQILAMEKVKKQNLHLIIWPTAFFIIFILPIILLFTIPWDFHIYLS